MKHEFTDKQITTAANKSLFHYGEYNSERGYSWSMTAESLSSFLDALPEPQDDWQECAFDEVLDTDQAVLFDFQDGTKIQGKPSSRNHTDIDFWVGYELHTMSLNAFKKGKGIVYRIPAPVVHPDPAEHPVILVDTNYGGLCGRHPFIWDGEIYAAVSGPIKHANPETITSWSPAKVVADDDPRS